MKTLQVKKDEVEALIKKELGIKYCAEDRVYDAPPVSAFGKTRTQNILGMKELFYVQEGFDCDNFAMVLRHDLKMRYWKKNIKKYGSRNGASHKPDVFVEEIKVKYPDSKTPHWFVVCLANVNNTPALIYRERTSSNIVTPQSGWKLVKLR